MYNIVISAVAKWLEHLPCNCSGQVPRLTGTLCYMTYHSLPYFLVLKKQHLVGLRKRLWSCIRAIKFTHPVFLLFFQNHNLFLTFTKGFSQKNFTKPNQTPNSVVNLWSVTVMCFVHPSVTAHSACCFIHEIQHVALKHKPYNDFVSYKLHLQFKNIVFRKQGWPLRRPRYCNSSTEYDLFML